MNSSNLGGVNDLVEGNIPTVLYLLSSGFGETGGGTQLHTWLLLNARNEKSFVIYYELDFLVLEEFVDNEHCEIMRQSVIQGLNPLVKSDCFYEFYNKVFSNYEIDIVHVQHFFFQSICLVEEAFTRGIPVIISLHDYFCLCPTFFLVDTNNNFCRGEVTEECNLCCASKTEIPFHSMEQWRSAMEGALEMAKIIIVPSQGVADIFSLYYHKIPFKVVEHGTVVSRKESPTYVKGNFNVAFPGHATKTKGSEHMRYIIENCHDEEVHFHVFGKIVDTELNSLVSNRFTAHGTYESGKLQDLLEKNSIHVVVLPSLSAETFSLTLSECWQCGIPVIASDIGALGSRIRETGAGILIHPNVIGTEWIQAILNLKNDSELYSEMCEKSYKAPQKTVKEMTDEYYKIYEKIIRNHDYFRVAMPKKLYVEQIERELIELRTLLNSSNAELIALKSSTFYKIYFRLVKLPGMWILALIVRKCWHRFRR